MPLSFCLSAYGLGHRVDKVYCVLSKIIKRILKLSFILLCTGSIGTYGLYAASYTKLSFTKDDSITKVQKVDRDGQVQWQLMSIDCVLNYYSSSADVEHFIEKWYESLEYGSQGDRRFLLKNALVANRYAYAYCVGDVLKQGDRTYKYLQAFLYIVRDQPEFFIYLIPVQDSLTNVNISDEIKSILGHCKHDVPSSCSRYRYGNSVFIPYLSMT